MAFPVSPGVSVSEIDLTATTPAISTSVGAIAGVFKWGPANTIVQISNETQLAARFGNPDVNSAATFFTAASFLSYANNLQVARASLAGAKNATSNTTGVLINNHEDYINQVYPLGPNPYDTWAASFPGSLGNSLQVIVWNGANWYADVHGTSATSQFAAAFPYAPGTSPYITQKTGFTGSNDEIHIAVVDRLGYFTGVANTVLERYTALSVVSDCLAPDGSSSYFKNVITHQSQYILTLGNPTDGSTGSANWGKTVSQISNTAIAAEATAKSAVLSGGVDGVCTTGNIQNAYGLFLNPQNTSISLLMTGDCGFTANAQGMTPSAGITQNVQNYAIQTIAAGRTDCMAFVSPPLANTQDVVTGQATSIASYATNVLNTYSSYGVMDSGYKYMYDKYNDVYRWVPLNGDVAGLCAYTDQVRAPWWSPAGLTRGTIKNSIKLAFNPTKADRDTLYQAGVNPVVSFPGQGTILFGDKTLLNRPSAFDRINVRRLFIVMEQTISKAAQSSLFEFNDSFTRAQFVNLVTPFLRTVQSQRGIYAYKVVCDTTNNTPQVIDANQFVGSIYVQPARSVNFIQLNFIAVQTGVSFTEVVGQF
jgi:hypothetical protein